MTTGAWAWLVLLIQIAVYETWSTLYHHPNVQTLSEWVWMIDAHHPWFFWFFLFCIVMMMLHLFGPVGWFGRHHG